MFATMFGPIFAGRADVLRKLFEGDTTTIIICVIVFGIMITIGIIRAAKNSGNSHDDDDDDRPRKKKKRPRVEDDDDDDDRPSKRKRRPHEW